MSNEKPIGTGLVTITSDYEYVLGYMKANMLKFQADFSQGGWTRQELDIISSELEQTAKFFAEEQGLNEVIPDLSVNGTEVYIKTKKSGELYRSIKSRVKGDSVILSANAKNSRNQYYAGHIEYGFHDRGGNFIPARPFLRPALYAVSESSKGRVASTMRELLESIWTQSGYMGYDKISSFGRLRRSSGGVREFYKQLRYGPKSGLHTKSHYEKRYNLNSKNNNFRQQLRNGGLRKPLSANRYDKESKRDRASFKTPTRRARPLKAKTKKQKQFERRRNRIANSRKRAQEKIAKKKAVNKARNLEPLSLRERKYLTDSQWAEYQRDYYAKRKADGTLRDYRKEKERADYNRQKAKDNYQKKQKSKHSVEFLGDTFYDHRGSGG